MRRTFVESRVFTAWIKELLDEETYRLLQQELLANPTKGAVMPGCGGVRKVCVSQPARGKGKRGGARVIYLDIPEAERIDLIAAYGKNEQGDLTPDQRKVMRSLAARMLAEAIAHFQRRNRGL
jgi:hypothetical protein